MSETSEPTTEPTSAAPPPEAAKRDRLRHALTWVGIVAGVVVVVAAIFVSGAATSWLSGEHDQARPQASCMMGMSDMPKGPMPGNNGPMSGKDCCGNMGPANMGPANMGPANTECCGPKKS